jgi:hypothetical protein
MLGLCFGSRKREREGHAAMRLIEVGFMQIHLPLVNEEGGVSLHCLSQKAEGKVWLILEEHPWAGKSSDPLPRMLSHLVILLKLSATFKHIVFVPV